MEKEVPFSVVTEELEINQNILYHYEEYRESAFSGRGTALYLYQFKIKKLKKKI